MRKVIVAVLSLLLLLPLAAEAQPYGYGPGSYDGYGYQDYGYQYQGAYAPPGQALQRGIQRLNAFLSHNPDVAPARLRAFVEREIAPSFDFDYMTNWAAGWLTRYLSPQQEAFLRSVIKERFLAAMVRNLADYQGGQVQYLRPRGNPAEGQVMLGVRVYSANGYPTELEFDLYDGPDGWKVYDVVAQGNSALAYYRNWLTEMARRYGVRGMLTRLAK